MTLRSAALLLPLTLLAACDRSEPEPVETRPQPILRGSVSDDMLRTDQMQAEAPLAAPKTTGAPGDEDKGATAATPQPKASPSPQPTP